MALITLCGVRVRVRVRLTALVRVRVRARVRVSTNGLDHLVLTLTLTLTRTLTRTLTLTNGLGHLVLAASHGRHERRHAWVGERACTVGHEACAQRLLQTGADPNSTSAEGCTARLEAAPQVPRLAPEALRLAGRSAEG